MTKIYHRAGSALLLMTGIAALVVLLPIGGSTYDLREFFIPWMNTVRQGGLSSISGEFATYTPPYIYAMYLTSHLVPLVGTVIAIKLIYVPFAAALAFGVQGIVADAARDRDLALVALSVTCVVPTLLVNAFLWGQADTIYTCFLVFFVLFASRQAPGMAAAMFGLALSFKLQAMFVSPFLLYLVLSRQMRGRHLLLIPLVYAGMMIPAAIAGRSWADLLTIYVNQGHYFQELALNAPNPWYVLGEFDLIGYRTGTAIGLMAAAVIGLAITTTSLRLVPSGHANLVIATLCAAVMPYALPKMHDRYFFVADILSLVLAFVAPRYWPAAILFQIGSLGAYLTYFGVAPHGAIIAIIPVTIAVGMVVLAFLEAQSSSPIGFRDALHQLRDRFRRAERPGCRLQAKP